MSTKPKNVQLQPVPSTSNAVVNLTVASNLISSRTGDFNPYEIRNELLVAKEKARVRYENGITLPISAEVLLANALRRDYNHRRTLSRNIVAATSQPRPSDACAHHVVAHRDAEAVSSRTLLYGWGIAINDADNGMFLPRIGTGLPGHPNAPRHHPHHRARYHLAVYDELQHAGDAPAGRLVLRFLKTKILSGALPL